MRLLCVSFSLVIYYSSLGLVPHVVQTKRYIDKDIFFVNKDICYSEKQESQLGSMQCVGYIMLYAGMLSYCEGELVCGQLTDGINNI